jgi:predicted Na+-dependent transporter
MNINQTLLTILGLSAITAVPSSMLVLSLKTGRPFLAELFLNRSMLIKYIIVMFIFLPALALGFYFIDSEHYRIWLALLIISISPPTLGMTKDIIKLGGNSNICTAWLITSILLSFIIIPLNLFIIQKIIGVNIDLGIDDVTFKLFIMFVFPMLIGFFISNYLPGIKPSVIKIFDIVSKIASIILIVCLLIIALPVILQKGIIDLFLIFTYIVIALIISYIVESTEKNDFGPILSNSVIYRLPAPALILASINGKTKEFAPEILSFLIISLVTIKIFNKMVYRKKSG